MTYLSVIETCLCKTDEILNNKDDNCIAAVAEYPEIVKTYLYGISVDGNIYVVEYDANHNHKNSTRQILKNQSGLRFAQKIRYDSFENALLILTATGMIYSM